MRLKRAGTASTFVPQCGVIKLSGLNGATLYFSLSFRQDSLRLPWRSVVNAEALSLLFGSFPSYLVRMNFEQWIIWLSLLGGLLFCLAAALSPIRRLYLAMPAVLLFLILVYEIRMDRWEKTVSAPIRLDMFAEIPMMILCLI